jgi:hypothetical protein
MIELSADFPTSTPEIAIKAQRLDLWGTFKNAVKGTFDNGLTTHQPAVETTAPVTLTTEPIVNPAAPAIETARRTPPPGLSPRALEIWQIKAMQEASGVGSTYKADVNKPIVGTASEPLPTGFSVRNENIGAAPIVSAQAAADEKAREKAAITRATSSTTYDDLKKATAESGITERVITIGTLAFRRITEGRKLAGDGAEPIRPVPVDRRQFETMSLAGQWKQAQRGLSVPIEDPKVQERIDEMRRIVNGANETAQVITANNTTEPS